MKIYLTRHGKTNWNEEGRLQGFKDSQLTEQGVENALRLGEHLKDIPFDIIYSSPLGRAHHTAKLIRGERIMDIHPIDELKEMGFGCWEGEMHQDLMRSHPKQYHHFWNEPHLYEPIDGETFEELHKRVKKALNQIASGQEDYVLVVAHTVVIKMIYLIIKDLPLEKLWEPPYLHDTSLTIIEHKDNQFKLLLEADLSHLK